MSDTTATAAQTIEAKAAPVEGHAGDVNPRDAWDAAVRGEALLVDVRTEAEWTFVGLPDMDGSNARLACIAWQHYPGGAPNPGFLDTLARTAPPETPVLFLCRSGARSAAAARAATEAGYAHAFNVADGFEGPLDADGQRGRTAGWQAEGLPWRQS